MIPSTGIFAVGLVSAALMGLAIQRGATCMVAAVDEIVNSRRATRAAALAEAALWVGGMTVIAAALGWLTMPSAAYTVTGATVAGGVLLGIGAWINRACVFGAVARIGSGEWAYLATPVGFFIGCLVPFAAPLRAAGPVSPTDASVTLVVAILFIPVALWRLVEAVRAPHLGRHLWHPHRATLLIAFSFVTALLSVGYWAYTDALAALARSMDAMLSLRGAMVVALLAGAIAGGAIAGKLRAQPPRAALVLRALVGGALMGMGAALVPGSNDGLILQGLPAFRPHAWVAVTVMTASIAAAILLDAAVTRARRLP